MIRSTMLALLTKLMTATFRAALLINREEEEKKSFGITGRNSLEKLTFKT